MIQDAVSLEELTVAVRGETDVTRTPRHSTFRRFAVKRRAWLVGPPLLLFHSASLSAPPPADSAGRDTRPWRGHTVAAQFCYGLPARISCAFYKRHKAWFAFGAGRNGRAWLAANRRPGPPLLARTWESSSACGPTGRFGKRDCLRGSSLPNWTRRFERHFDDGGLVCEFDGSTQKEVTSPGVV